MNDFEQCLKPTFGKLSVARKSIINGGAIRPGCLLFGRGKGGGGTPYARTQ